MTHTELSRRNFATMSLGSMMTYSLVESLFSSDAFDAKIRPVTNKWLTDLNDLSRSVKAGKLRQVEWQMKVEELFAKVELKELLKLIDFENFKKRARFSEQGERGNAFSFPKVEGVPTSLEFGKQIFALKKGQSVIPHGHNNMTTAFMILQGDFRGRHYQRLEDGEKDIMIRPTIDEKFGPGDCSTVSDFRDNIHWFKALTGPAFVFNVHVLNIRDRKKFGSGRIYVDPTGEKLRGGMIRAPRISRRKAKKLFG